MGSGYEINHHIMDEDIEVAIKGFLEYILFLGYLEFTEPILLSRKSFSTLNSFLEVGRKYEEIENIKVSVR